MRRQEMEEQFNKKSKQGWRTKRQAVSEDRKHTSEGIFVAIDSKLGAVIGKEEGAVTSQGMKESSLKHG